MSTTHSIIAILCCVLSTTAISAGPPKDSPYDHTSDPLPSHNTGPLKPPNINQQIRGTSDSNTIKTSSNSGATDLSNRAMAPDFRLRQRGGPAIRLSMLKGRVSALYFWTPRCFRCSKDIQKLEKLVETYSEHGFIAFVVSTATTPYGDIHPATDKLKTTLPLLYPASQVNLAPYQLTSIPTLVLIDAQGRIAYRYAGDNAPDKADFTTVLNNEFTETSKK